MFLFYFCCFAIAPLEKAQTPAMRASVVPVSSNNNFTLQGKTPAELTKKGSPILAKDASQVFFINDQHVFGNNFNVDQKVVQKMLDSLVCAVTGKKTVEEAWQSLIKTGAQGDRIGIKVTTEPGLLSGTHREVAQALVFQLIQAGVKPENIIIWDRRREDLVAAGYTKIPSLQLRWVEYGSGYDPMMAYASPVVGELMYGDFEFKEKSRTLKEILNRHAQFSNESHYAVILSRGVDKVINVPSLCDSYYSGVNGALVNMSIRNIDNWRRFIKEPFFGDPYIANIYSSDLIRRKVVMTIMDGLTLQYAGGPRSNPAHSISNGTIFASFDPVAIDATALALINEQRVINRLPKVEGLAGHVQSAASLNLGNADKEKVSIVPVHF